MDEETYIPSNFPVTIFVKSGTWLRIGELEKLFNSKHCDTYAAFWLYLITFHLNIVSTGTTRIDLCSRKPFFPYKCLCEMVSKNLKATR